MALRFDESGGKWTIADEVAQPIGFMRLSFGVSRENIGSTRRRHRIAIPKQDHSRNFPIAETQSTSGVFRSKIGGQLRAISAFS
jgi:hypothetical protein